MPMKRMEGLWCAKKKYMCTLAIYTHMNIIVYTFYIPDFLYDFTKQS